MKRDGTIEAQMNEPMTDSGGVGSDSVGRSGDMRGLSAVANAADESAENIHAAREERIRRSDWSAGFSASYRTAQTPD
jgi:hypothetical protein